MNFAKTLKKLRTKAKMTGYALARESRVDPTYLARLESGEKLLATLIARAHRSHLTGARRELLDQPRNDPDEVEGNPGAAEKEGP